MVKPEKKSEKKGKEQYDVEDIIVIEDKKKGEDFDLGREDLVSDIDDDELDFDDFEADDGGD
ncbi:MAG: hypothetical protein WCT77_12810 [Bacteroidota bacterium]